MNVMHSEGREGRLLADAIRGKGGEWPLLAVMLTA